MGMEGHIKYLVGTKHPTISATKKKNKGIKQGGKMRAHKARPSTSQPGLCLRDHEHAGC